MTGHIPERLKVSTFKLNALLGITKAINQNLTQDELLARYESLLKDDLNIGKIVIFKFDSVKWHCLMVSGMKESWENNIDVENDLIKFEEISFITSLNTPNLIPFDIIMPIYNNNKPLAFILIGDIDEEGEGISPVIKHLHFMQTLSNIIIVAIENIRLFQESIRQIALKKEMELASRMQSMLIPKVETLPRSNKIHIMAFYHPHMDVGGDYYDVIELSQHEIGFCIADVSGKGISAALLMSNFQATLRAIFTHEISLTALVEKLNVRVLSSANGEKFITLFIAKYNYATREMEYINAGHNPPILYETDSKNLFLLKDGCVGMGMLDEIPIIKKRTITITQTTKLLCYTDGLVEVVEDNEVAYGTSAIEKQLSNTASIEDNIEDIIESQHILSGNKSIFDDVTMLGVEFF